MGGIRRYATDLSLVIREQRLELDVVHAVQPVMFPRGEKFVVTCHDLAPITKSNSESADYGSLRGRLYAAWFRKAVERSFRMADIMLADSSQTELEIREIFGLGEKTRVVHPGVSLKFKPVRQLLPRSSISVGCPRDSVRRAERLLRSVSLSGKKTELRPLKGVQERDIVAYYNSLDYFLDLAPYTGFGYNILEARRCGIPVITLRRAMIPEEVKRFTIQVEDEEDAASQIASGVSQPREELPFTLEKFASDVLSVYREVSRR